MEDVATNAHSSDTQERNGTCLVGAPKGSSAAQHIGSKYVLRVGDVSDLGVGSGVTPVVAKGAVDGVNTAFNAAALETKYTNRFDDPRYYSGDSA